MMTMANTIFLPCYTGLCNLGRGLPGGRDRRNQQTSRSYKVGTSGQARVSGTRPLLWLLFAIHGV